MPSAGEHGAGTILSQLMNPYFPKTLASPFKLQQSLMSSKAEGELNSNRLTTLIVD